MQRPVQHPMVPERGPGAGTGTEGEGQTHGQGHGDTGTRGQGEPHRRPAAPRAPARSTERSRRWQPGRAGGEEEEGRTDGRTDGQRSQRLPEPFQEPGRQRDHRLKGRFPVGGSRPAGCRGWDAPPEPPPSAAAAPPKALPGAEPGSAAARQLPDPLRVPPGFICMIMIICRVAPVGQPAAQGCSVGAGAGGVLGRLYM